MSHDNTDMTARDAAKSASDAEFDALLRRAVDGMPRAEASRRFADAVVANVREHHDQRGRGGFGIAAMRAQVRELCDGWAMCGALGGALAGLILAMVALNSAALDGYVGANEPGVSIADTNAPVPSDSGASLVASATNVGGSESTDSVQLLYADLGVTGFGIMSTTNTVIASRD